MDDSPPTLDFYGAPGDDGPPVIDFIEPVDSTQSSYTQTEEEKEEEQSKKMKKFTCHICKKSVTHRARHMILVHDMGELEARNLRYDQLVPQRKKERCPKCERKVVNLRRHLTEVEKLSPEERQDVMEMVRQKAGKRVALPLEKKENLYIPDNHPQKDILKDFVRFRSGMQDRRISTVRKEIAYLMDSLMALNKTGNLEVIFKNPTGDTASVVDLYDVFILKPLHRSLEKGGTRVASGHYNKLVALTNFLKWLLESRSRYLAEHNMEHEARSLINIVKSSMGRFRAARTARTRDINKGTKPIDVEVDLPVAKLLAKLCDDETWSNLLAVRDSILAILTASNLSRLGELTNMTIDQFQNASEIEEDLFCVNVAEHKTAKTYGDADIFISKEIYGFLKRYINERTEKSNFVFCTTRETPVSTSQAGTIFKRLTGITATQVRKGVAITHREDPDEVQAALSEAMLHTPSVHKKWYATLKRKATTLKGLRAAGSIQVMHSPASSAPSTSSLPNQPSTSGQKEKGLSSRQNQLGLSLKKTKTSKTGVAVDKVKKKHQQQCDKDRAHIEEEEEEEEEDWPRKKIPQKPFSDILRFEVPLNPVEPDKWPQEYTREPRMLRGMHVCSRNKFTADQLQLAFRYLGGYRRKSSVPAGLINRLKLLFPDFEEAFKTVSNKNISDKMRKWPLDKDLIF